ncbi:TPA: 23S rRNA (uracil(1939)-C(5))-methyltransferase RlmD [Candidatus Gracilibacteria bacterium]|nr:23S rRNA (uracil(1939)-C(5))-methyltransferase RlmD [Candidatus Gracilibacteria bacterium]
MKKNEILENIRIDKLIFGGKGLAMAPDGRKIIIAGGAVPLSIVNLRILKVRTNYFEAQIVNTVKKSPLEQELPAHYQVYGGCKWLPIAYEEQLKIKSEQVKEAFHYIEKYWDESSSSLRGTEGRGNLLASDGKEGRDRHASLAMTPIFHSIVPSPEIYGYRNKVEFSWGKYISEKEGIHDDFRFGFHAQGQFDRIIDCDFCVLADDEINAIFREMNTYSRASGLPTYDPKINVGFWRHFVVRKAHFTGEIMLILSVNHEFEEYNRKYEGDILIFAGKLMEQFPHIASIYLLLNSGRADIVTGEAILMKGKPTITENLLGKSFEINPKSFFQTNSLGAEKLYSVVRDCMKTSGGTLLDLYAGTGTIGILLADRFEHVYSVELVAEASKDGAKNALKNGVTNITFINEKTEKFLPRFLEENVGIKNISLVIDPPRDGMHPDALPDILKFNAKEIIYVSCNPATLARDLDYILANSDYRLTDIIPVDMFPHTHHIETVVRLEK